MKTIGLTDAFMNDRIFRAMDKRGVGSVGCSAWHDSCGVLTIGLLQIHRAHYRDNWHVG